MNFVDLSCFVMAAEEMNFTRAAKRLYISQQSLSSHIAKLEEHYGVCLFDRSAPLTMTREGNLLLKHARAILDEENQIKEELQDLREGGGCQLSIGISGYRSSAMMPVLLPAFYKKRPECRVKLLEAPLAQVTEALLHGRVEMVIGYESDEDKGIRSDILYEEEIWLVIPGRIFEACFSDSERERLLSQTRISFQTARKCPLILMGERTWLREMVEAFGREKEVEFYSSVETASIDTMISLCMKEMGAMVCPEIYLDEKQLREDGFKVFRLSESMFRRKIAVNYLDRKYQPRIAKEFIALAKQVFHKGWHEKTIRQN